MQPSHLRPVSGAARDPAGRQDGRRRKRFDQRGFTIFEAAMAGFIMVFGIATSIFVMQAGFKSLNDARDTTLASQIMQSEIERIRLLSWTGVNALIGSTDLDLTTMFTSNATVTSRFKAKREAALDSTRTTDVMNITISVSWKSYDGRSHTRTSSTMYSKNGLYDYYYTTASP